MEGLQRITTGYPASISDRSVFEIENALSPKSIRKFKTFQTLIYDTLLTLLIMLHC